MSKTTNRPCHRVYAVTKNGELDDDMRLQLAARDLLDAAEKVVARWERGDLAGAVRELDAAIAKATGGAP